MTKTSYKDSICHEVKYNPADKESDSYKLYIKPSYMVRVSNGSNSWINSTLLSKAMDWIIVVWHASMWLTRSFYSKARLFMSLMTRQWKKEKTKDTHVQCLQAITEHVFPADNPLLKQKTYTSGKRNYCNRSSGKWCILHYF
jgi:hypothetical protein